jgi:hypothetical protein
MLSSSTRNFFTFIPQNASWTFSHFLIVGGYPLRVQHVGAEKSNVYFRHRGYFFNIPFPRLHQSDFVRTRVMKRLGGIYLDEDAYVVRDVVSLRQAGFRNVVGKQTDSMIACVT